jgi:hypothetical protein
MNNVYCFWTGTNSMSDQRAACLEQLRSVSECQVVLVTPENLQTHLLADVPLHPAYEFLSETHKSDYLRTYFMNFKGGGYSDIKRTTGSWTSSFETLANSPDKWMIGYKEVEGGVAYGPVSHEWANLIGNCAYICKPHTPLTEEWYSEMIKLLDSKLERLREHPATYPQDNFGTNGSVYPMGWNEMLGQIFHRVSYGYKDRLLNTLPSCVFYGYR